MSTAEQRRKNKGRALGHFFPAHAPHLITNFKWGHNMQVRHWLVAARLTKVAGWGIYSRAERRSGLHELLGNVPALFSSLLIMSSTTIVSNGLGSRHREHSSSATLLNNPSSARTGLSFRLDAHDAVDKLVEQGKITKPVEILAYLLETLKANSISGPKLFRLRSEFTKRLGHGSESDVLGFSPAFELEALEDLKIQESLRQLNKLAIKRPKQQKLALSASRNAGDTRNHRLASQLRSVRCEIEALCDHNLQRHRNIVKLQCWGLCLDTLEDADEESLRIPLLVFERAQWDLSVFLGRFRSFPYSTLRQLCLDIGEGLGALHKEGICHGDLKPVNVLLFPQHPIIEGQESWVAKLCDFGMTRGDIEGKGELVKYAGTCGWRAPEVQNEEPLRSGALQRCDIYAYGLLVWSTFTNRGQRILSEEDERCRDVCKNARTKILELEAYSSLEKSQISVTLRKSLHWNPLRRDREPWKAFSTMPCLSRIAIFNASMARKYSRSTKRLWEQSTKISEQVMSYWLNAGSLLQTRSLLRLSSSPYDSRQQDYETLWNTLENKDLAHSKSLSVGHHRGSEHHELTYLYRLMQQAMLDLRAGEDDTLDESLWRRLYCLARYRSRFPFCCWERASELCHVRPGKRPVVVPSSRPTSGDSIGEDANPSKHHATSEVKSELSTDAIPRIIDYYMTTEGRTALPLLLAWLCRGEIGAHELQKPATDLETPTNAQTIWQSIYGSERCESLNRPKKLNESEELELFLIMMKHGIHLEHSITPKHQSPDEAPSLFIAYLQRVREEVRGRVVGEICGRFKLACRRSRCIRPETRYYMTGKLPEGETKESEIIQNCTTTALHQCVGIRSYEAVEQLVKHGFVVDARDAKHWTALGYARATMQQDCNKEDPHQRPPLTTVNSDALTPQSPNKNRAMELNRIIGLLEQNTSHAPSSTYAGLGSRSQSISKIAAQLPLGWEAHSSKSSKCYIESYTNSLTFKPPCFSLFDDRRLALGYRRMQGDGHTYFLDLIQFITADNLIEAQPISHSAFGSRFPAYDDRWFLDEPFMAVEEKEDVIGQIRLSSSNCNSNGSGEVGKVGYREY